MTFRAKSAVKRTHRPAYEADHRRTLLLNIGFGLVVLAALLILGGAVGVSYYNDHLAALASVNDQGISKDDYRDRVKVDTFRLDYQESLIRSQIDAGHLDAAAGSAQTSAIAQLRQSLPTDAIDNLIDATLQAQLAAKNGVTVTDQQIDAQVVKDATTPETRHVWVIGVKPEVSTGATASTDAQKAAAKTRIDQALADLNAGKPWADVAKQYTDDSHSSSGGDVGWVGVDATILDKPLVAALFALPVNGLTTVQEGTDGLFRIGRVSEIAASTVDTAYQQKIKDAGLSLDAYRRVARATLLKQALTDKIVADATGQPTVQRRVSEIFLAATAGQEGTGDEVQVRHILFSPKHDPTAAQSLPATDPAWTQAQNEANAAYQELLKNPAQFEDIAKTTSDDTGTKAAGGLLPYYTKVNLDPAFGTAIFADGLKKDQILAPVKSAFGWHVIQFLDRRKPPRLRMDDLTAQANQPGADFAAIAKASSEAATKDQGGDIGWIAKYQVDSAREIAIFKPSIGALTQVIQESDGYYVFKIVAEETRLPDATQVDTLKADAFSNFYAAAKNAAQIVRNYSQSGGPPAVQ